MLIVDTVGFAPGILLADGRVPHSGGLHVVERFSLEPERLVLARSYVAEDPAYFVGTYTGADTVLISDLPYHGTTECEDRTVRSDAESSSAATSAPEEDAEDEAPWWMFWKLWD